MPYARSGRESISYEISGEGPAIVLISATSFDRRLWTYQIARWSLHFRVLALDLRGHGLSSKPQTPCTLRDLADDVMAVCADAKIERAVFAGVSAGSAVAMLIGLEWPAIVDGLLLVGGSSRGPADPQPMLDRLRSLDFLERYREFITPFFAPGFAETPHGRWAYDLFDDAARRHSGSSVAHVFLARTSADLTSRVPQLTPPVLVVNGEYDMSLADGRETASRIQHASHATIAGTGHCCPIENPEAFDRAVLPFLCSLRKRLA